MKRKLVTIILSALILFSNSGWAISFHYCKNALSSVSLAYFSTELEKESEDDCAVNQHSCCANNDEENKTETSKKKCCNNTAITSSISDSISVVKVLELELPVFIIPTPIFSSSRDIIVAIVTKKHFSTDFFTRLNPPPLYELYCQRVFYLV